MSTTTETRGGRTRRAATAWSALAAVALAAAWAAPALACPVCYGEASGEVIAGTRLSVAFLGGLVYLVLFGGVGMVFVARRRALAKGEPHHGLHLVTGTGGHEANDEDDDTETSER